MARQMKDTSVQWIGQIPKEWKILPLGNCFKERNEKVSDYDWEPLSVTKQGIVKQLETAAKSDAHDDRKKVCKNDFVINSRSDRKQSCGVSPYDGSVSLINIVLESRILNTKYVKYLLKNYGFAEEFYRWGTGIVADLWSTKWERMKKIMLPIPDDKEQQLIADYLDRKIAEINNAITKTKETIEDYKKYKQAVITEAVTKGLNPEVEMKDSGIEWIGEIPKHWEVQKVKHLGNARNGLTYSPGDISDEKEGILVLRSSNIKNGKLIFNDNVYVNREIRQDLLVKKGDILICSRNGSKALIGKNAIIDTDIDASFGAFMMIFRCNTNPKYMKYILDSEVFKYYLGTFLTSTINQLTNDNFANMKIVYCSHEKEQEEIIKYLDIKCGEIDSLIAKKEALVADLEEYKKSLIYEYVTGKKEVLEEKIVPLPAVVNCKNKRFAQAVLLTRVLDEFGDYHSGRVKVAKTLYVLENHIGFDFEVDSLRKVAGPLDKQYYDAEAIVRHNNWFNVLEDTSNVKFFEGKDKDKYLDYYDKYFKEYDSEIQRIIDVFKNLNMNEAELLATAYASWNDFIIKGESFNKDDIVKDIFAWDDSKKRFPKEAWLGAIAELEAKGLSPLGHGKLTILDKE